MKYRIKVIPSNLSFEAKESETILDAALNSGFSLEYSCKNGDCGLCESLLVAGSVTNKQGDKFTAGQTILTCCSSAKEDVILNARYYPELANVISKTVPCKVDSFYLSRDNVIILRLRLPPTAEFNYLPGQYVNLSYKGIVRSYSIANIFSSYAGIELHIRNIPNGKMSSLLFGELVADTLMRIEGPCGTFFVRENSRPIVFLAGGTGFAPVKAMVEKLIEENTQRTIYVYWGMDKSVDFYSSLPKMWDEQNKNICFIPVVSGDDENWSGRRGFVHHALMDDFKSLKDVDVYACGSPVMINAAKQDFLLKGLVPSNFYSDAFTANK